MSFPAGACPSSAIAVLPSVHNPRIAKYARNVIIFENEPRNRARVFLEKSAMAVAGQALSERDVAQVKRVTWVGLFVNLGLSAIKFALGLFGRSQAVVADAVHSLSDIATDAAVLVGVRFWSKPPDRDHPFGHRRIETLVTVGIAGALAAAALGLGYKAIVSMREPDIGQPLRAVVVAPLLAIVSKEVLYRWTVRVGRRTGSMAVVANAWHHRSDAFSSVPVLLAVILARLNPAWAFADRVGAMVVSLFIIKVAWDVAKPALKELAGQAVGQADEDSIVDIVSHVEGVRDVHALRTRRYGGGILLDVHVLVPADMTVREGHDIAEEVKRQLLQDGPSVQDALVHIEPDEQSEKREHRTSNTERRTPNERQRDRSE